MRSVFLALPLESDAKERFGELVHSLQEWEDILRFQSSETPHLTLQFWKEVGELELKGIKEQSLKISSRSEPFDLRVIGVDTFGSKEGDNVLFLKVEFSPQLASLKKQCPWDVREPFHPHITVARIRHPQKFVIAKKKIMKTLDSVDFVMHVDRLRLYAEINQKKQTPIGDFVFPS